MQDNFNLAKFVRQNRLLNENIGGYVDIKPLKEMSFDEMMGTAMEGEGSNGKASLELDWAAGMPELKAKCKKHGLTFKVVQENGPGGGNPLVKIMGPKENIIAWLNDGYVNDEEELEMFVSDIEQGGMNEADDSFIQAQRDAVGAKGSSMYGDDNGDGKGYEDNVEWMETLNGDAIGNWTCYYEDQQGAISLASDNFPNVMLYATPGWEGENGIAVEAHNEEGDQIDLSPDTDDNMSYIAGKPYYPNFEAYAQDMKQILAKVESMLQGGEAMNELEKPKSIYVTDDSEDEKGFIVPGDEDEFDSQNRMMDLGGDQIEQGIISLLDDGFEPEDVMDFCKMIIDAHSQAAAKGLKF